VVAVEVVDHHHVRDGVVDLHEIEGPSDFEAARCWRRSDGLGPCPLPAQLDGPARRRWDAGAPAAAHDLLDQVDTAHAGTAAQPRPDDLGDDGFLFGRQAAVAGRKAPCAVLQRGEQLAVE
jgi:hypothetical protein